jgi:hypothetical protein
MVKLNSKVRKLTLLGFLPAAVLAAVVAIWVVPGKAQKPVNTDKFGIAIKGYDTVAYFTEGRALKGKPEYEVSYQDARWRFSSAANRDLFKDDPERYIPQYGGY